MIQNSPPKRAKYFRCSTRRQLSSKILIFIGVLVLSSFTATCSADVLSEKKQIPSVEEKNYGFEAVIFNRENINDQDIESSQNLTESAALLNLPLQAQNVENNKTTEDSILVNIDYFPLENEAVLLKEGLEELSPQYDPPFSSLPLDSQTRHLLDCSNAVVTPPIFPSQEYTITQSPVIYEMPAWTVNPVGCTIDYQLKQPPPAGRDDVVTFDPNSLIFTYYHATDVSLSGIMFIWMEARVDSVLKVETFMFLTLKNPCLDATLTNIYLEKTPLPDISYNLFANSPSGMQWMHDSFVLTQSPVQTSPICGDFVYIASMDGGINLTSVSTPLSYDMASQTFTLYTEDEVQVGAHEISLTGQFIDYPNGISKDYTFTLNIYPLCDSPASLSSDELEIQQYTITEDTFVYTLPPFIADPFYCKVTYSSNGSGPFTFDSDTWTFTFPQNDDMSLVGQSFTFKITGRIGDVSASKTVNTRFQIDILSPCAKLTYLTIEPTPLPEGMSYILFDYSSAARYEFQHDAFIVNADSKYLSLCGQISYTATFNGITMNSVSTPMSYNAADQSFGLYSEDIAFIGIKEISVQAFLVDDLSVRSETLFTYIEIDDPCLYPDLLNIIIPNHTDPPRYMYTGSTPSLNFTPIPAVVDPYICSVDAYSCENISIPIPGANTCNFVFGLSVGTFEPTNGSFTFSSIDMQTFPPGTYVIEITATATSAPKSESFQVQIILEDPCPTVSLGLLSSPFTDQQHVLGQPPLFQAWQSNLLIQPLTQVDCGEVSVEFYLIDGLNSAPDPAIFEDSRAIDSLQNGEFITLYSEDQDTAGSYSFLYKVSLLSYQTNFVDSIQPFTITVIDPCDNAIQLIESASLVDQEYTITEAAFTYQVPKFVVDPSFCGITYSVEVGDIQVELVLSFDADSDVRSFTFHNQVDLTLAGDLTKEYLVTVKAQTGAVISTALTASSSFNLILKNPCIDPSFFNIQTSALPIGIEYALYQRDMSFMHDAFSVVTQPIQHSLCGSLAYLAFFEGEEISPISSPVAYDSLEFYVYSQDLSLIGTRMIQVGAYLSAYPETKSPEPHQQMKLEFINPCNDPNSLIVPDQIDPLTYLYTSSGAHIDVTPFIADPPVCPVTYECISVSGQDIDFKCNEPGVVSFDKFEGTMTFNTLDMAKYSPGSYEITIRGTVGIEIKISEDVSFTLVLENPCPMSQLQGIKELAFGDMVYILGADQIEMSLTQSELVEIDTRVDCGPIHLEFVDKSSGNALNTSFFSTVIQPEETFFSIVEQVQNKSVGDYFIHCRAFLEDYPENSIYIKQPFQVSIRMPETFDEGYYDVEPEWLKNLEDQQVELGKDLKFEMGNRKDERRESQVFVDVNSQIKKIVEYEPLNNIFIVNGTFSEPEDVGLWTVRVKIVFYENYQGRNDNETQTKIVQVYQNSFQLHIIAQQESTVNETKKNPDDYVIPEKKPDDYIIPDKKPDDYKTPKKKPDDYMIPENPLETIKSLQEFGGVVILESPKKIKNRPVPYIFKVSSRGVMTIAFDRPMKIVQDPKVIPPTKVAINYDLFNQDIINRRNLAEEVKESGVWFEDLEREELIHMMLIDAIEVKFQKDPNSELPETEVTGFQWDLIGFSTNFLQIKLEFKNPEAVGSFQFKDYVTVTFWGVQFFQDNLGIEVELGYQVKYQIQRQLDDERAEQVEKIIEIVDIVILAACLSLLFLLGINARILPTWMFLNSIQLIVHAVLLSTSIPSNLNYFLLHYLNLIRMNPESLDLEMEVWQHESGQKDYELSNQNDSAFSSVLGMCGYKHDFSRNLMIVIIISVVLLITLAILSLIDFFRKRHGNRKCSAYMCNFNMRFFYELFLEICLSVLIHIASMQVMLTEYESKVSIMSWAVASLYLVAILAFIGFLISRFWSGGPYIRQAYSPGLLCQSWWGIRSLSQQTIQRFENSEEVPQVANINDDDDENQGTQTNRNLLKLEKITPIRLEILTHYEDKNYLTASKPFQEDLFEGGEPSRNKIIIQFKCEVKNEAKMRIKLAERVQISNFYRTLFYGLKWNHEHNVALVQPLAFVLRRILYALVIVFMVEQNVIFGALIMLITCLIMLVFVVQEAPWEDRFINWQHFFNEIVFYFVCVGLMSFSGVLTDSGSSLAHGWLLIGMIVVSITYNVTVIVYDMGIYVKLFILRYFKGYIAVKARLLTKQKLRDSQNKILPLIEAEKKAKKLEEQNLIDDILQICPEQDPDVDFMALQESQNNRIDKNGSLPLLVSQRPTQMPITEDIYFDRENINADTAIKIKVEVDNELLLPKTQSNTADLKELCQLDTGFNFSEVTVQEQNYGEVIDDHTMPRNKNSGDFIVFDVIKSEAVKSDDGDKKQSDVSEQYDSDVSEQYDSDFNRVDSMKLGDIEGAQESETKINEESTSINPLADNSIKIEAKEEESSSCLGKDISESLLIYSEVKLRHTVYGKFGGFNSMIVENETEEVPIPAVKFNRSADDIEEKLYEDAVSTPERPQKMYQTKIEGFTGLDPSYQKRDSLFTTTIKEKRDSIKNYSNALKVPKKDKFAKIKMSIEVKPNNPFYGMIGSQDKIEQKSTPDPNGLAQQSSTFYKLDSKERGGDTIDVEFRNSQSKIAPKISQKVEQKQKNVVVELDGGKTVKAGPKFVNSKKSRLARQKSTALSKAGSNIMK